MPRGSLLISFDLEKAWGIHDSIGVVNYHGCLSCNDENIKFFLHALEQNQLKSDWAFVGAMRKEEREEWQLSDETFSLLKQHMVNLMSHSYSHVEYKYDNQHEVLADHKRFKSVFPGIKGIIFPRNRFDRDLLIEISKLGFKYYRDLSRFERKLISVGLDKRTSKWLLAMNSFIPIYSLKAGLIEEEETTGIEASLYIRLNVSSLLLLLQFGRIVFGVVVAIFFSHRVHFWLHPHNLCCSKRNKKYIHYMFKFFGYLVRKGLLKSEEMNAVYRKL